MKTIKLPKAVENLTPNQFSKLICEMYYYNAFYNLCSLYFTIFGIISDFVEIEERADESIKPDVFKLVQDLQTLVDMTRTSCRLMVIASEDCTKVEVTLTANARLQDKPGLLFGHVLENEIVSFSLKLGISNSVESITPLN